jgi:hypothetical protein
MEKQNTATDAAALIIPSVAANRDRHPKLQRFMLANDSVTVAVEIPIWLFEHDIAALENKYRVTILPKQRIDPDHPDSGHHPRHIVEQRQRLAEALSRTGEGSEDGVGCADHEVS